MTTSVVSADIEDLFCQAYPFDYMVTVGSHPVYVGRPSRWGNPFIVHAEEIVVHEDGRDWFCGMEIGGARQGAVDLYREWLPERLRYHARVELAGRDLACWCPLAPGRGGTGSGRAGSGGLPPTRASPDSLSGPSPAPSSAPRRTRRGRRRSRSGGTPS